MYRTPLEVLVGVLNKLEQQKDKLQQKIAELTLRIKYLEQSEEDVFDIMLELTKKKTVAEAKLEDIELEITSIRRGSNGSTLDQFLDDKVILEEAVKTAVENKE